MSGTTATWQIPYSTSTDTLCSVQATLQAMALRVDDICENFDSEYQRLRRPPAARVLNSNSYQVQVLTTVAGGWPTMEWDTIDIDTANLVHIYSTQPFVITIGGMVYWLIANEHCSAGIGPTGNTFNMWFNYDNDSGSTRAGLATTSLSGAFPSNSLAALDSSTVGTLDTFGITATALGTNPVEPTFTFNGTSFAAFWVSDSVL